MPQDPYETILHAIRQMQWERAKGSLAAMVCTLDDNGVSNQKYYEYRQILTKVKQFIEDIDVLL